MLGYDDILSALHNCELSISPLLDGSIQPASVDLHISRTYRIYKKPDARDLDLRQPIPDGLTMEITANEAGLIPVAPWQLILASTVEVVGLNRSLAARIEGRSSLGRLGLSIHRTAGFIDPGFMGTLTLEILNESRRTILIPPLMPICQISVFRLDSPTSSPYSGRYMWQEGPTPASGVI